MDEDTAFKTWEFDNSIELVSPPLDSLYAYDPTAQSALHASAPWRTSPHHFTRVRISAVALLKMVMHARSGGSLEIMGLMQGHISADTFVVTDAFRLPVQGTETRVNAQEEANEYMPAYLTSSREAGQPENAVGWYHSHPGYGCWLSGVDVDTQITQQTFQDPFLAVVIDPDRTVSAGKVEIGAFRTYPANYTPPGGASMGVGGDEGGWGGGGGDADGYQTIPLKKIEDFGAHSSRYYPLEISHFKSTLDAKILAQLWNKYWVATLSGNSLLSNREYTTKLMEDLAAKVRRASGQVSGEAKVGMVGQGAKARVDAGGRALEKVARDGNKIAGEEVGGLIGGVVKGRLFNDVGGAMR